MILGASIYLLDPYKTTPIKLKENHWIGALYLLFTIEDIECRNDTRRIAFDVRHLLKPTE